MRIALATAREEAMLTAQSSSTLGSKTTGISWHPLLGFSA